MYGPQRRKEPGRGHRGKGRSYVATAVRFDEETFERIRGLAIEAQTGIAEQIRLLVEWGLEEYDAAQDGGPS